MDVHQASSHFVRLRDPKPQTPNPKPQKALGLQGGLGHTKAKWVLRAAEKKTDQQDFPLGSPGSGFRVRV